MKRGGQGRLFGWATLPVAALLLLFPAAGVAATITPDSLADNFTPDANCSLREAIQIANTDSAAVEDDCGVAGTLGTDTIALGAGTYQLGPDASFDEDGTPDDNAQGDLDVNGPLTIDGQGAGTTTISSSPIMPPVRVLHALGGPVSIEELTVTGGHPVGVSGGGVLSNSGVAVTLLRSAVSNNSANFGGGVSGVGPLTVTDSTISGNNASANGGGISTTGGLTVTGNTVISGNDAQDGAGIATQAALPPFSISGNVTITGNDAIGTGGGLFLFAQSFDPTISGATISNNTSGNVGGGIFFDSPTGNSISVSSSQINGNTGEQGGGGLWLQDDSTLAGLSILGNDAGELVDNGMALAIQGGGIYSDGDSTVSDSWIDQNTVNSADAADARQGGGIHNAAGTMTVLRTTVSANVLAGGTTRVGGGLSAAGAAVTRLENATISDNTTNGGQGGGLFQSPGTTSMSLVHTTIADNSAATGPGITSNGPVSLAGSIVVQGAAGLRRRRGLHRQRLQRRSRHQLRRGRRRHRSGEHGRAARRAAAQRRPGSNETSRRATARPSMRSRPQVATTSRGRR